MASRRSFRTIPSVPWTPAFITALVGCLALFLIISHLFGSTSHGNLVSLSGIWWHETPLKAKQDGFTAKSKSGTQDIGAELDGSFRSGFVNDSREIGSVTVEDGLDSSDLTLTSAPPPFTDSRSCDLYQGNWIYDPDGPLYTNNTCPVLTQSQNCQGNGRPDKGYENWRWKPHGCDLPRFNPRKFLELMRNRTVAFVGDSIARNQMESLLCILWQVEVPRNRGNRRMQRWYFASTSTTIVRIWSAWLVHKTSEPIQRRAPKKITEIHLDAPDEAFMEFLPSFDIIVLSSGHWFSKQSAYVLNGMNASGRLAKPKKPKRIRISNAKAFGISVETALTAIVTHANYTGLTILRSYTPDHYEGGAWNKGGSCGGNERPASKVARNGYTYAMHEKQVAGFKEAAKKARNGSRLKMMDITEAFGYRHDGHPGPYRDPDRSKLIGGGSNGKAPEDCLHWCMPGPVDVWNEIMLEIIRREFEGA